MKARRKHISENVEKTPRLLRVLEGLIAAAKAGVQSPELEQQLEALAGDKNEIAAARIWLTNAESLQNWLEFKSIGEAALRRELNRKDLTIAEGLRLYKALNENARYYESIMRASGSPPRPSP